MNHVTATIRAPRFESAATIAWSEVRNIGTYQGAVTELLNKKRRLLAARNATCLERAKLYHRAIALLLIDYPVEHRA